VELVAGACEGDCFFFHCASALYVSPATAAIFVDTLGLSLLLSVAGHTTQKPTEGEEEEDGKDECKSIPYLR
jgi:hypothetical protein